MANRWLDEEVAYHPEFTDVHQVFASNSTIAVWLRVARFTDRAWFQGVLLRAGRQPIVLAEEEIPHPGNRWELRSSGLWADHNCETPLDHWSYGLEAFALALDDPDQLVREGVGDRVPIGWELDFDAKAEASSLEVPEGELDLSRSTGYHQRGVLHGLLLTKEGETAFEAPAVRHHWWGDVTGGPDEANITGLIGQVVPDSVGSSAVAPVGLDRWSISLDGTSRRLGV